jgi:hypothetical protein
VDEYIKACTFPDQKYSYTAKDIVNYEKIEIAFRLINKKRFADALKWLSKLDSKNMQLEVFHRLKISALEGLGEYQEVQKIRVALFRKTLDPEIFREIRKYSGDNFAQSLVKEILKVIYNGEAGISVCNFLVQEGFLEECSNFVESHMKKIGDQDYKEIHPIAEALQEKFPLVAILLYRKMIKNVLYYGLHSYYSKIIKDLETCTELDKRIIPVDKKYMRQSAWVREIRDDYARREDSFWSKYDDFLEEGVIRKRVRRGY